MGNGFFWKNYDAVSCFLTEYLSEFKKSTRKQTHDFRCDIRIGGIFIFKCGDGSVLRRQGSVLFKAAFVQADIGDANRNDPFSGIQAVPDKV